MRPLILTLALCVACPALAEVVPEKATLGAAEVTLYPEPFLTADELATLRLVQTNEQALAVFVPGKPGTFAALAVSPEEGLIRDGKPVASAVALADFPDLAAAREAALAGCAAAKTGTADCVVVLEVAPAP